MERFSGSERLEIRDGSREELVIRRYVAEEGRVAWISFIQQIMIYVNVGSVILIAKHTVHVNVHCISNHTPIRITVYAPER